MAGLREYFWSHRVLQWIPIAGVVAVARRSPLAALALGAGSAATSSSGPLSRASGSTTASSSAPSSLRSPPTCLLFASLPLLVPTLAARLGPLARPA